MFFSQLFLRRMDNSLSLGYNEPSNFRENGYSTDNTILSTLSEVNQRYKNTVSYREMKVNGSYKITHYVCLYAATTVVGL